MVSFAASYHEDTVEGRTALVKAASASRQNGFLTKVTKVGAKLAVETFFIGSWRGATVKQLENARG